MTDYAIWKPEHDGHAPPNWRVGMAWDCKPLNRDGSMYFTDEPSWHEGCEYKVPAEALNSPNDDYPDPPLDDVSLGGLVEAIRQYPAEELAKHGITLAPEKDWATELWADLMEAFDKGLLNTDYEAANKAAIELLRTRFEQMKGEG